MNRAPSVSRPEVRESIAVGIAVSVYGVSFGALAVGAGLDVWQACALSLLMFTGGSQFAFIGVVATGGVAAIPAAIATASLLGARNAIYALTMTRLIPGPWYRRLAAAQITIDESVAVANAQSTVEAKRRGFWWTGVLIFVGWNTTTLIGALLGDLMGSPAAWGLDAAAGAAFLGLLWPRLKSLQPVVVAIAAAVVAAVLTPWLPAGLPILAAGLVAVIVGLTGWFGKRADLAAAADPVAEPEVADAIAHEGHHEADQDPPGGDAPDASPSPNRGGVS